MRQVLGGLSYMHGCGVGHRDLKPGNIVIPRMQEISEGPEYPVVQLMDFGLSKKFTEGETQSQSPGTLPYVAP